MSLSPTFGIQSWCFRNFKTIPEFARELKKTGVNAAEVCGVQVDFNQPETFDAAVKQLGDAGVQVLSIGVQRVAGKPEERNYFEFCRKVGCRFMSISFPPTAMWEGLRKIEAWADEYDIRLGIHNHGGRDWLGNSTTLQYIFENTSSRIGLTLDTAWAIDAGQDPLEMVERFASRLYGVHVKDFTYTPDRRPHDVIIGSGNLDLPALKAALKKVNFDGFMVIEYEADEDNPVPALSQCVRKLAAES